MRIFDILQTKSIDELAKWIDKFKMWDDAPWIQWYDQKYCKNCEPIVKDGLEYGYCELYDKCRYFEDMDWVPDNEEMIKMWLESEAE